MDKLKDSKESRARPVRGKPREQYERTYVLLHKSASAADVERVIAASWDRYRFTVGQSADDAGVGDLDSRRIVIVDATPWGGEERLAAWLDDWYPGCELVFLDSVAQFERWATLPDPTNPSPPPAPGLLIGLHDEGGGRWMAGRGIKGVCLVHEIVQKEAKALDFRHIQDAGITVICRLNWGYADGTGTLPGAGNRTAFIEAVANTILQTQGVDYFHVGNEPNNRSEWPGFNATLEAAGLRSYDGLFPLVMEYVVSIYNEIWYRVGERAKMGPPPLDPYFGPGSNNLDWWRYFLLRCADYDALFLHAKTQTNDPVEVWSRDKFTDWPLEWQYLHARAMETYLARIPSDRRGTPVFCTEANPQHQDAVGGAKGWKADNAGWIHEFAAYARMLPQVKGIVLYRFTAAGDQACYALEDRPILLGAIQQESED